MCIQGNIFVIEKKRGSEASRMVLPSLATFTLFVVAIFAVGIPSIEDTLIEQKKKQITALAQTTWSILSYFGEEVVVGNLSRKEGENLAKEQIRALRYGPEGKNYFWISDMHPSMVMHPYRMELEGQDLSTYVDQNGKYLFNDFVDLASAEGEGFVPYMWQWKGDTERISPKLSFIKLYSPWGWIVGTGVYLDDVEDEISDISRKVMYLSLSILAITAILLSRNVYRGLRELKGRLVAEAKVRRYQNELERLVEERTAELLKTRDEVKALKGILPLCSFCKKVRDDSGYWNQVEVYISEHSEADVSHGICPECMKKHYPEYSDE